MGGKVSCEFVPLHRERMFIITGGNTGLGYELAKWISALGASVVIACRSKDRAMQAISRMREDLPETRAILHGQGVEPDYDDIEVTFTPLDLASFQSVLQFSDDYTSSGRPLHVLICNAGIGMAPFSTTEDGLESMLQVNYLSQFLLAAKLLPVMRRSGEDCRLLLMSSLGHRFCRFDLHTMNYPGDPAHFDRIDYYGRTKLYQIMQMHCMARRLKGTNITVNSAYPGHVNSDFDRNFQDMWRVKTFYSAMEKIGYLVTPYEGASSMLHAAVRPELRDVSGVYFVDCKPSSTSAVSRDSEKQELLWLQTLEYLRPHLTEMEIRCMEGDANYNSDDT